jgi:macrolide phosphotransferase
MARSHLTLAALATSAVPGLDAVAASAFGTRQGGAYDSALITGRDGRHWIIRVPRTSQAEADQSADLVALRALSTGVRTRLPFAVSTFAGQVPVDGTRGVVYEFVYGNRAPLSHYDEALGNSVGTAIAAIHSLPTSFVTDAGLPTLTSMESQRSSMTVADRASATGLLPAALVGRWERALEDAKLWQFQPTVIHGSLSADSVLVADGSVSGILGWQNLRVGDPALDLQWILGTRNDVVIDGMFAGYENVRGAGDRQLVQRARLYSELELAKWLLHGTEVRSTEIVDDAVALLTGLVDTIRDDVMNPIGAQTMPTMAVDEVEAMLDRQRRAV